MVVTEGMVWVILTEMAPIFTLNSIFIKEY